MRWLAKIIVWVVLLSGTYSGWGQATMPLTPSTTRLALAPGLSVYRDVSRAFTLDQARQAYREGRFQVNRQPWPAFGFTHDAIWVHFAVHSASTNQLLWFTELPTARMDELDWYVVRGDGLAEHLQAGNLRPHSAAVVDYKFPVFPLQLNADERAEVFLRVHSLTSINVPLQIWAPGAFIAVAGRNGTLFAAFFGYIASLIVLSLIISVFTRNRDFVIYSLSLVWLALTYFITSGYYAWLRLPAAAVAVHAGVIATAGLGLLMMLLYLRNFFDLPATHPGLNRWVVRITWLNSLLTGLLLVGPYWQMNQLLLLQSFLIGAGAMSVAGWCWWRGNRMARFYVLAWLVFWLQVLANALQYFGWVPILAMPEMQIILAITLSMTLFFMALADRVRQVRLDMNQARQQVLQLEQQASRELQLQLQRQQRLIRDLHDGLGANSANVELLAERGRREAQPAGKDAALEQITRLALENSLEVRSLMDSLDSDGMSWSELIEKARRRAALVFDPAGVNWKIIVSGDLPEAGLPALAGLSLLRLLREGSNNILKHSFGRTVAFCFGFTPQACCVVMEDDGCGFQPDPARPGRGLKHMRQRVEELGGTLRLETGLCQTQQNRAANPARALPCPRDFIRLNQPAGAAGAATEHIQFFSCTECVGTRLHFDLPLPLRFHDHPAATAGGKT